MIRKEGAETMIVLSAIFGFLMNDRVQNSRWRGVKAPCQPQPVHVFELSEGDLRTPHKASLAYPPLKSQPQLIKELLLPNLDFN